MPKTSEDVLEKFMKMTGLSRDKAEKELAKSVQEMCSRYRSSSMNADSKYSQYDYPHFLPSDDVKKYTIRVSLKCINHTVWRKFECPSNISLRHLTELILELMGWGNEHLNQVQVGQTYYVPSYQRDPDLDWGTTFYQEDYELSDVLSQKGKTIRWEYDFGDSWKHEIRLSSVAEYQEGESRSITFKGGKGMCPPEDCGGIWGYQELLELHEKRKARKRLTSEEKERLEWYGIDKDFDPDEFYEDECIGICEDFSVEDESLTIEEQNQTIETCPLYDEVLSIAFRIRQLEPWEDLDDSDVYAIKMQDGSEIYVATMGQDGQSYEIQFFDGSESFLAYFFMLKSCNWPDFEIYDTHNWVEYKSVMFQKPEDEVMRPALYRHIEEWAKAHDVQIEREHGYPFLQHFQPHRYPSMMTTDEASLKRLKEALEAVEWFSQRILDSEDLTEFGFKEYSEYATEKGGKVVPLIVKTADGYKVERTKLPKCVKKYNSVIPYDTDILPLRSLPKKGALYCRLIHFPMYVASEDNPETIYYPLVVLSVEKNTEHINMSETCDFSDTFEQDVMSGFIKVLTKEGYIPQRIITDNVHTEAFLKEFCKQLGIILEYTRTRIPQLTRVCQYLYDI